MRYTTDKTKKENPKDSTIASSGFLQRRNGLFGNINSDASTIACRILQGKRRGRSYDPNLNCRTTHRRSHRMSARHFLNRQMWSPWSSSFSQQHCVREKRPRQSSSEDPQCHVLSASHSFSFHASSFSPSPIFLSKYSLRDRQNYSNYRKRVQRRAKQSHQRLISDEEQQKLWRSHCTRTSQSFRQCSHLSCGSGSSATPPFSGDVHCNNDFNLSFLSLESCSPQTDAVRGDVYKKEKEEDSTLPVMHPNPRFSSMLPQTDTPISGHVYNSTNSFAPDICLEKKIQNIKDKQETQQLRQLQQDHEAKEKQEEEEEEDDMDNRNIQGYYPDEEDIILKIPKKNDEE